ncbi:MAG: L-aspartate oxidase [Nitrospirota bacterium]
MKENYNIHNIIVTDFLVIGSGVAGLSSAIELGKKGKVIAINKGITIESSSEFAQGGIAVALSEEDSISFHFEDTIKAGKGLCNKEAVRILVEEGPEHIKELISWGAAFDKENGEFLFAKEAAHSKDRILRAKGDATGGEIVATLLGKVKANKEITKFDYNFTIDIYVDNGICKGAIILNEDTKEIYGILAKAIILTTGGIGQIYSRTTNPLSATGDGIAMAYYAGAKLDDMEFIQFHPTSLYLPNAPSFLLSEAIRGEGAILRNIKGETFMYHYHTDKELAPRDTVSRAIWNEMINTGAKHVFLDITHLNSGYIKKRFPNIYTTCLRYNIDITEEMIPVSPAVHFIMGGIKTDSNGATNIPGLYAAGEVACTGVHGANRLASNSLLEGLVFGKRSGMEAVRYADDIDSFKHNDIKRYRDFISGHPFRDISLHDREKIRNSLRRLMWDNVGIIRSESSLLKAMKSLKEWLNLYNDALSPYLSRQDLELKNMITNALLITSSALNRKESIGAHFRSDFPEKSKAD